jgi:hypothetical protein
MKCSSDRAALLSPATKPLALRRSRAAH